MLIESGLVDSLAAVDVALAVEREFGCKIPPTEIDVHLESVHTLAAFIAEPQGRLNAAVAKAAHAFRFQGLRFRRHRLGARRIAVVDARGVLRWDALQAAVRPGNRPR